MGAPDTIHAAVCAHAQGIWVASDEEIRKLNKTHRGKDKATDVLSFPMTRVRCLPVERAIRSAVRPP